MKRFPTYITAVLVVFYALGLSFMYPAQAAATSSEALSYCESTVTGGQNATCAKVYDAGRSGKTLAKTCPDASKLLTGGAAYTNSPEGQAAFACQAYWQAGKDAATKYTYCKENAAAELTACVKAYKAGLAGKTLAKTCPKYAKATLEPLGFGSTDEGKAAVRCSGYWAAGSGKASAEPVDAPQPADTSTPGDDTSSNERLGCAYDNALTWIICPVVTGLVDLVTGIDGLIMKQLTIDIVPIFGDSSGNCPDNTCDAYYKAWKQFRNIALGLMVIAGLIVVISQALGTELLDAYMIRKTLPRILIAAIGITLSWPLMQFFVTLINDLGWGIRYLIQAPFRDLGDTLHIGLGEAALGTTFFTVGAFALGIMGLLSYALMAALAVLIAILVLILRQVAIILLMILAPLAIVAYILPNTQKFYKFWWESFSKALLMFPLIVAFIATGQVFSAITIRNGSGLNQLIGFIAYFAPYFLIPLTFKFAGGFMGQLGGFVNKNSSGGFAFLQKRRKDNTARRIQRARGGKLWREGWGTFGGRLGKDSAGRPRSISRYANRAAIWGLDADEMIPGTIGSRGGRLGRALFGNYAARAGDLIGQETMGHIAKAAQVATANGPLHHKAERALAGTWGNPNEGGFSTNLQGELRAAGFEDGQSPETAAQMQTMAGIMRQHGSAEEISAASDLENMAGFMGNLNKDPEMYRAGGNVQAVGALMLANSGRLDPAGQAQVLEKIRTSSPHGEALASRLEKQTSAASRLRAEMRHGRGLYQAADGSYHSVFEDPTSDLAVKNVITTKQHELLGSKGETIDTFAPVWSHILGSGPANGRDADGRPLWSNEQETVRQQIFQLASQYSTTDPDAKRKTLDFMDRVSRQPGGHDYRSEFNNREQRGYDPNLAPGERPQQDQPPPPEQ